MRADRLVATVLLLQARGRVTAAELSAELEVSVATARRDLEALSAAGIPVYPQPGRGGGWQLLGGARTDLSGLTSPEARALFLLVGPAASVSREAKSALRKLVRALPAPFRADAEAAADAVVIDPAGWGRNEPGPPPAVQQLQEAVVRRVRVRIEYRGWDREPQQRVVAPWALVQKAAVWYLLGAVDGAQRTYRVDRILRVEVMEDSAERPDDFDIATAWEGVVGDVERRRHRVAALVVVDTGILPYLRAQFGARAITVDSEEGERTRLTIAAQTEVILARGLAGWADQVEVIEPASLRAELARIGASLARRYRR